MCTEALFTSPSGPGKDLEYCIVRPGGLTLDPPNGVINVLTGEVRVKPTPIKPGRVKR